jgi:parvulin-like peptidyl-prolyl isomerase
MVAMGRLCGLGLALLLAGAAAAQQVQVAPSTQMATVTPSIDPTQVAATVNGKPIYEKDLMQLTMSRVPKATADNPRAAGMIKAQRLQNLEFMIDAALLDELIDQDKVTITDAELHAIIKDEYAAYLKANGYTPEEFESLMLQTRSMPVDEFLKQRRNDPGFLRDQRQYKWLRKQFPDFEPANDDVTAFYDNNAERRYKHEDRVRVRQIVIQVDGVGDDAKAAARKKAEDVLAKARAPGADFAALARQYSSAQSAAVGGEVGYVTRTGHTDPAIVEIAFKLEPGQVSDVLETGAGFHIVQVVDHKPAEQIRIEQVKDGIRWELTQRALKQRQRDEAQKLRQQAKIEFPPGADIPRSFRPDSQPTSDAASQPTSGPAPRTFLVKPN